jgi:hypothetical protein
VSTAAENYCCADTCHVCDEARLSALLAQLFGELREKEDEIERLRHTNDVVARLLVHIVNRIAEWEASS